MKRGVVSLMVAIVASVLLHTEDASARKRRVRIKSTPPGATIYLDKESGAPLGVTPTRKRIEYGMHEFIFVKPGYKTERVSVDVGRRTRKVVVSLKRISKVDLKPAAAEVNGAQVKIDGQKEGTIPMAKEVDPGRHLIEVDKPGFKHFSQWVDLKPGQVWTLPVTLVSDTDSTGILFVSSDVAGAKVFVDGKERGTTPQSLSLPIGPVLLEVTSKGKPPYKETVEVKAGEKTIVQAKLLKGASEGTLMILSNVPNTAVTVDGTDSGLAPATVPKIPVGTHIIEGRAEGFQVFQTTATVKPNEQTVVKLELKEQEREYGTISVRSSVANSEVYLDGGALGPAPFENDKIPAGPHSIIVRAPGYQDYETRCQVSRDKPCNVMAELVEQAKIAVTTNAPNAVLFIDGKEVGPLPYQGTLAAGRHTLKAVAEYHANAIQDVDLQTSSAVREINLNQKKTGLTPEEQAAKDKAEREAMEEAYAGNSTFSGAPIHGDKNAFDFSFGVPYIAEMRGTVGLADALAVSVVARGLERDKRFGMAELGMRFQIGVRPSVPVSLGVYAEGYGGTNFQETTNYGAEAGATFSLHFGGSGSFNITGKYQYWKDEWKDDAGISRPGQDPLNGSQEADRILTSVNLVLWGGESSAFHMGVDFKSWGKNRQLYRENYFGLIETDPGIYGRMGFNYTF